LEHALHMPIAFDAARIGLAKHDTDDDNEDGALI
jgi:hypothetical protein